MPKHKKTREQKIAATQKHQEQPAPFQYSLNTLQQHPSSPAKTVAVSSAEGSIAKDLQKTVFISLFLLACEITLYVLLHQHLLKLPWTLY